MAQRKEAKKIKVRDLKPKKDAKGGFTYQGPRPSAGGHQYTGPGGGHGVTRPGNQNT